MNNAVIILLAWCTLLLGQTLISHKQLAQEVVDGLTIVLVNGQLAVDTSAIATRQGVVMAGDTTCVVQSGSPTAYVGAMRGNALTTYEDGMRIVAEVDVTTSGGEITLDCGAGPLPVYQGDGVSNPTVAQWSAGSQHFLAESGALNFGAGGWRIFF